MRKSPPKRAHQQMLKLERVETHLCIRDAEREKCKTLLTQLLTEVIRAVAEQEHDDE